jgi:uncharacterized protein
MFHLMPEEFSFAPMYKDPTDWTHRIAQELSLGQTQVLAVQKLLSDGATIPFIARYRKEVTGSLDEVQIAQIRDRLEQLEELGQRKAFVLKTIEEQGKLTPALKQQIGQAQTLSEVEDLYLPYKPKRKPGPPLPVKKAWSHLPSAFYRRYLFRWKEKPRPSSQTKKELTLWKKRLPERGIFLQKTSTKMQQPGRT